MSNVNKRLAELKLLLKTLELGMEVFSEEASPNQKRKAAGLKGEIAHEIAELEGQQAADAPKAEPGPKLGAGKAEKPESHAHGTRVREAGDLRNPADIISAITEVVNEMRDHHKGSEPVGFVFVLVHKESAESDRLIVHGAGGGDEEVMADVLVERGIKLKLGLSEK